jgi:hypothetical protein
MDKQEVNRLLTKMIRNGIEPLEALEILRKDDDVDNKTIDEWVESFNQYRANR